MTSGKTAGRKANPLFTDRIPKALKREAGRADSRQVPANIRVFGVNLEQNDRAYIRGRLAAKLGKHAASIERVTVRVEDVNSARGGIDQVCRIKVVLSGLPSALVQTQAASLADAINGALTGVERAVRRSLERRRMKPIKTAAGRKRGPDAKL
jgi:ribosome-associated translation inhibitor RaiA